MNFKRIVAMSVKSVVQLITLMLIPSMVIGANPWAPEVIAHSKSYKHPFEDTFASTLEGVCNTFNLDYDDMNIRLEDWKGYSKNLETGWLPVKIGIQTDSEGRIIKAPLFFYIPGAFSNLDDKQNRQWMHSLTQQGYHTVVFPNPWGTDFIARKPKSPIGYITTEAQIIYDAMRFVYQKAQVEGMLSGPVRVAGVSYGGFLSTMVTVLDAEHNKPIINLDTTAVAPPYDMGITMDHLDSALDDMREDFAEIGLAAKAWKFARFCRLKDESEMKPIHYHDAKGLVAYSGFHDTLTDSVILYDKIRAIDAIPDRDKGKKSDQFKNWRKNFNYGQYFDTYAPGARKMMKDQFGKLMHWVDRAKAGNGAKIRLITADDDFLNNIGAFDQEVKKMILLKDGGHYGYRGNEWFFKFLDLAFGSKRSDLFDELYKGLEDRLQKPKDSISYVRRLTSESDFMSPKFRFW